MYCLISPAKTFKKDAKSSLNSKQWTCPELESSSEEIVQELAKFSSSEMKKMFRISDKTLPKVQSDWQSFWQASSPLVPAVESYNGMVFKKLGASSFTLEDWLYAQDHLSICSFVYGLLRPMDSIRPYRMEGDVDLGLTRGTNVFEYWRDELTELLIKRVKTSGSAQLFFLASEEMKFLFHWSNILKEIEVITPKFLVRQSDGSLKQIVIYTKMARGTCLRSIIKNRLTTEAELQTLSPEGFQFSANDSSKNEWLYIL